MIWTQWIKTLAANAPGLLVAANPDRKALRFQVTGANPVTVVPWDMTVSGAPTVGQGFAYTAGAFEKFDQDNSVGAYSAVSTAGTTIILWELTEPRGILPANSGV